MHPRVSLEHNQFPITKARRFEDECCAGHAHSHRLRFELGPAGILRHVNENGTAAQVSAAPGLVETENRVLAQARDGHVVKRQFRARLVTRSQRRVFVYLIVFRRRSRRRIRRQNVYVANNLRDPRFFLRRIGRGIMAGEE